ncbi:hypothetical protein EV651_110312 [Kribbella sp. VKM Ac-2571]|uniref:hypothetical protein n=1 Tax=Kribbella sp. VKM Ac-2571 TaxID=2512222 RepID=UPI001060B9E7|nr:hypothetical protein [Kribbella sp. VKM Ac-2571]TDO58276.1 hypothetical protein EV651_110312 [Kribbella sp. VKM Ac-2571]
MPDVDTAILQLYALVLYPHLVASTCSDTLDPHTTQRLIDTGVDMFLQYYDYRDQDCSDQVLDRLGWGGLEIEQLDPGRLVTSCSCGSDLRL